MLTEHCRRVHEADKRATKLAHDSIVTVSFSRRSGVVWDRLAGVAWHIQVARGVWLDRVEGKPPPGPINWFEAMPLDRLASLTAENDARWDRFFAEVSDEQLAREVAYQSSEGVKYVSVLRDICQHVLNHATYHRGQIARMVSELGGQRATTDYIALTREARNG